MYQQRTIKTSEIIFLREGGRKMLNAYVVMRGLGTAQEEITQADCEKINSLRLIITQKKA